jgi:hypothetical protein
MMKKRWSSILLFCLINICCAAQTAGYKFYSVLDSIKTSGFYNIEITPALSARLKTDYSDLRIVNDSGKWVPHVLHFPEREISNNVVAMDLRFTKTENTNVNTTLIIENRKEIISNLGLIIKNTAAERFCSLSGSDDQKNWFVINDSILVNPVPDERTTTNTFRINFPSSSYKFFKIIIYNSNKNPFDIKGVVQFTTAAAIVHPQYKLIENPEALILQKDSGKISYIKITQQQPFHFDNISVKISGSKYFYRNVDLYIPNSGNHSFSNPGQLLQSFTISNNSTLQFKIPQSNAAIFYLLIHNEDNLPLTVNAIKTSNSYSFVTSYLEKGNRYKLILDNASAISPNYDLTRLSPKISDSIPFLTAGKILAVEENNIIAAPAKNNKWILWAAITAALFILLLFTKKMIAEVNKRKQDDSI